MGLGVGMDNDLAKCEGDGCRKKEKCYRFTVPATPQYQSYLIPNNVSRCPDYWPVEKQKDKKLQEAIKIGEALAKKRKKTVDPINNRPIRKCVYIAGAYSPNDRGSAAATQMFQNMRVGIEASAEVLKLGHAPFSPWLDFLFSMFRNIDIIEYYEYSIAFLDKCEAMVLVGTNWEDSAGVKAEIAFAKKKGIPIYLGVDAFVRNQEEHL